MKRATQAAEAGTLPGVTYKLEFEKKAADWPDPAVPEGAVADPAEGNDPNAPQWAGDLYAEGDETDPVEAFAAFTGDTGATAWLDVSPDGTTTGWVKDGEQVYRYSDPNAWALDVDGAAMTRAGELDTGEEGDPMEGDPEADPEADPDADGDAEGDADADGDGEFKAADGEEVDAENVEVDDATGHDPNGDTPGVPGDGAAPEAEVPEGALPAENDGMDPRDDQFFTRKKKLEGKALAVRVTTTR